MTYPDKLFARKRKPETKPQTKDNQGNNNNDNNNNTNNNNKNKLDPFEDRREKSGWLYYRKVLKKEGRRCFGEIYGRVLIIIIIGFIRYAITANS